MLTLLNEEKTDCCSSSLYQVLVCMPCHASKQRERIGIYFLTKKALQ